MKFFTGIFFLAFIPFFSPAQPNVKQNLIVVHFEAASKTQFRQKIYSYHFLNGSFVGRDELLSFDARKEARDYIRTDRGHNTLYKERYLVTGIGNIIDLLDKKVLFDGKAKLVRCSNDSAVFYTNDAFKGKFYSVYDFKEKQYKEVKDVMFKPKLGRDVEFDKTAKPFTINYYPVGKPKITLSTDAGYGQEGTKDKYVPDPAMIWLDNDNFIYAHFNQAGTELSFYKINVDSKASTLMAKMPVEKSSKEAELITLTPRQIVMQLGSKQFLIDLDSEAVMDLQASKPVSGFTYELKNSPTGRTIKLYNKETGKYNFEPEFFAAGDNIAVFVKEMVIGTDHYQQGLMVWNATRQKWEHVEAEEILTMIGWIKE